MTAAMLFTQPHKIFLNAGFVDFVKQNQQNRRLKRIFFSGECRQMTFETAAFKMFFRRSRRWNTFHTTPMAFQA
jgi:hypothetical protein